jgi:hypothetical protein
MIRQLDALVSLALLLTLLAASVAVADSGASWANSARKLHSDYASLESKLQSFPLGTYASSLFYGTGQYSLNCVSVRQGPVSSSPGGLMSWEFRVWNQTISVKITCVG